MSSITPNMVRQLQEKLDSLLFVTEFRSSTIPPIKLTFDPCGTNAGLAYTLQYHINLNPILLVENFEYMQDVILGHELAHVVTHHYCGYDKIENHGIEWQTVMELYGIAPNKWHNLDTTNAQRKVTRFNYACGCENLTHRLATKSHRNIMVHHKDMICNACNQVLICIDDIETNEILPKHLIYETKVNKARWIMTNHKGTKHEIIKLLMEGAGLSLKGANTYYYNLRDLVV